LNAEVIKNFRLEIKTDRAKEIGEVKHRQYVYTCRNCNDKIPIGIKKEVITYDNIEFVLSSHLMMCKFYSNKLEDIFSHETGI